MSHGPSTFGSMITSSLSPTAATISVTSSSAQGELSALIRVHNPVAPKSQEFAIAINPARAACFASAGIASSRLPRTTSTSVTNSGTLLRTFSMCGGTKWIIRSSRSGNSRSGAGAPIASGLKKLRGSFIAKSASDHSCFVTPQNLYHFAAHEFRLRDGGCDAFPHQGAAQRTNAVDKVKRQSTRAVHRQKIRKQAPVQQIDRERAGNDVSAPFLVIMSEHLRGTDVAAVAVCLGHNFGDGGRIANA